MICLGCVIKGETAHFEYVSGQAARGIARAGYETGVPVIYQVLSVFNPAQAAARVTDQLNRGREGALAAIEMARLMRHLPVIYLKQQMRSRSARAGAGMPRRLGVRGGLSEARIVAREKPIEHALGLGERARLSEAEFDDEPILKGAKETLDAAFTRYEIVRCILPSRCEHTAAVIWGWGCCLWSVPGNHGAFSMSSLITAAMTRRVARPPCPALWISAV